MRRINRFGENFPASKTNAIVYPSPCASLHGLRRAFSITAPRPVADSTNGPGLRGEHVRPHAYNIRALHSSTSVDEGRGEPGADEPRTGPADLRGGGAGAGPAGAVYYE